MASRKRIWFSSFKKPGSEGKTVSREKAKLCKIQCRLQIRGEKVGKRKKISKWRMCRPWQIWEMGIQLSSKWPNNLMWWLCTCILSTYLFKKGGCLKCLNLSARSGTIINSYWVTFKGGTCLFKINRPLIILSFKIWIPTKTLKQGAAKIKWNQIKSGQRGWGEKKKFNRVFFHSGTGVPYTENEA